MAKDRLDHVKIVRRRGKVYHYFRTGDKGPNGNEILKRLPDIKDTDYGAKYSIYLAVRRKRENRERLITVVELSKRYQLSKKFLNRKPKTQKTYLYYIKRIEDTFANWPASDIDQTDIRALMRDLGPAAQKMLLNVVRVMWHFGRVNQLLTNDPAKDIEVDHEASPHEPWPEELIKRALADPVMRLPVGLLYYTGNRIEAVCRMRWTDIEDGVLHVPPHKRTGDLYIPIHKELAAILAEQERTLTTIICRPDGQPLTPGALRQRIQKWALGKGEKIVPHGLRKNAVGVLIEVGCTVGEVSAITGQSLRMVEHYARKRNTLGMAKSAMRKWENNAE